MLGNLLLKQSSRCIVFVLQTKAINHQRFPTISLLSSFQIVTCYTTIVLINHTSMLTLQNSSIIPCTALWAPPTYVISRSFSSGHTYIEGGIARKFTIETEKSMHNLCPIDKGNKPTKNSNHKLVVIIPNYHMLHYNSSS